MKRRVFSFITALALCLNLCPAWAFAAEADTGPCPHHTAHTADCGYAEPTAGQPCGHEHTEACYSDGLLPAEGEEKPADACAHVHDDTCGYVPEDPGAPCTFVCRVCPVEELIRALPERVTADNGEQVGEQLDEIQALYGELTEAEQEQVDLSPCAALMAQFEELDAGTLDTWELSGSMTLTGDTTRSESWVASGPAQLDTTDKYTFTYTGEDANSAALQVTGTGELKFLGKVQAGKTIGIKVESGGSLIVPEELIVPKDGTVKENTYTNITAGSYAVYIAAGADVKLSAGTYVSKSKGFRAIFIEGDDPDYAAVLGDGCAFYDENGNVLDPDALVNTKYQSLTVGKCADHTNKTYEADSGAPTHTWTCANCGASGTEPCSFDFVQDGDGTSTCAHCGHEIAITVDPDDLSGLIYDGTVKPEEVGVTVTLDGTTPPLVKDTDYTVEVVPITDAGQATVTVTGLTFNGTFVKTYTVAQATPGIDWDNPDCAVDYDGSAVTAGELPDINITINTPTGEDLHPFLKYAYTQNGTDFTDGLPTDAGTYEVKAYLEESQNYEAAETDPLLALTIKKIDPITAAPVARTLTFNREVQELVTAGVLDPVAKADGLTIEFATSETGDYATAIPTGTNAGTYTVWYRVTGLTANYNVPDPNPAEITGVEIQRKQITPEVTLSQYSYQYDNEDKQPAVTVKDPDGDVVLSDAEYTVAYENNRDVSTDGNPAKAIVTDSGADASGGTTNDTTGNYTLTKVEKEFKITSRTQDALSITQIPGTFVYGNTFTLGTTGGSGNGLVTWKIIPVAPDVNVATVDATSGQVTITGHGSVTVQATKSGEDPATGVVNYEDAIAQWTFTAGKRPVTAVVTAEDKTFNGSDAATVHAVVASDDLAFPGDEITIGGLTGTFSDENAGADKTVTVNTTGAAITGTNSEHYAVTYSSTTVKATIHKATPTITTAPVPASQTYSGSAQALIGTRAVVDPASVPVEYALSETGPYSTDIPKETNAGTYTVWYRVQETRNYTGTDPESVTATIAKKAVSPTIALDQGSFVYDGTEKKPTVTLYEDNTKAATIPADEYTVAYSDNINVGTTATVTVTAKDDGNYTFDNAPVTKTFTITEEQAQVLTAPDAAGDPLTFNNRDQKLVTAGTAEGGTMVYSLDGANFTADIPDGKNARTYTVYYKVQGDANHSDSDVGQVAVTIIAKTVKDPTIELYEDDGTTSLVSYTYDGYAKEPKVVVKDKDDGAEIDAGEYNIVYSDNTDAGRATVTITDKTDKPNGNYVVSGSTTFVIQRADITDPNPTAANPFYNGTAQPLLIPGTTTGGTIYYALGTPTSEYHDYIPTGVDAGSYRVYYKVTGDENHNSLEPKEVSNVTIQRKPLTDVTIELTPKTFEYDGKSHLPAVTVKDGDTALPAGEYTLTWSDNAPTQGGTYTVTITDAAGGNYDLTGVVDPKNKATFTIGKVAQAELVIEGKPAVTNYGDVFSTLTTSGGSSTGAVTWTVTGPATIDASTGEVTINGVGEVTVTAEKAGDNNYEAAQAQLTFTAAPKPVTAAVTVQSRDYDGTTDATVTAATIPTLTGDTVTITPASITAAFEDPHAGTGKTVTLDTSKVSVSGADAAKYAISYPETVTADITKATTQITTRPEKIDPLTYNRQAQALITTGATNVGFLEYSLDGVNYSTVPPTATDAKNYTVHYKVTETDDYFGVADATISVPIAPKPVTPRVVLSGTSYTYNGSKQEPTVTLFDGDIEIPASQYEVTWANADPAITDGLLTAVGTYKATIKNVTGGNYTIDATAEVHINPATQDALHITGQPEHVYYGDVVRTLTTTGGTGEGTVTWTVTDGGDKASFDPNTSILTITGIGSVTVQAERTVPNYGTAKDSWTFTVDPKPVEAVVTIAPKDYDGGKTATVASVTVPTINGDTVTIEPTSITAVFDDANAGTGKAVKLNSAAAVVGGNDAAKYTVSYPATATGDINPKTLTGVTVTLSDHDLQTDTNVTPNVYYYLYDGQEKKPGVIVTADDGNATPLTESDYTVSYANNKNVSANGVKAAVTVTAKAGGNYTFPDATVNFEIREAGAGLTSNPTAKDLTYTGALQELVTVGAATGGTVVYKLISAPAGEPAVDPTADFSEAIPTGTNAGDYIVEYKVKGDANHADTAPGQVTVTIKPKEITPNITLDPAAADNPNFYKYTGATIIPGVIVKDGAVELPGPGDTNPEYSVSYRDNVNAGTATVTVSDANGGNYIVNGTATFEITKAAPTVTAPAGKTDLYYTGELQDLVTAGVCGEGTVEYSLNGGNYSSAIPKASAVGTYTIKWKVTGDANHSDTAPDTLTVTIDKNKVTNPTINLSSNRFTYDGNQHKPDVTVTDNHGQLIPQHEYTATFTGTKSDNMTDVDTYTVTIAAAANSNYEFTGTLTRTFEIAAADQEAISITGTKAQVYYGDTIHLGATGGTGDGTVAWTIAGNTGTTLTQGGLLTVKDVGTPIKVTVTRSKGGNYTDVSATWEFTAAKKPVTAVLTGVDKPFDGNANATVKAKVDAGDLVFGDTFSIPDLTGTFDNENVGTNKTITITGSAPTITDPKAANYEITYPATATASILAVAATVDTEPAAKNDLTYNAAQSQELVTAGAATGGTMVYSLDGTNFTAAIPKAKDAGTYTVSFKAQGDQNHTDSEVGTKTVTIAQQAVTPQIELSPPSGQYDGKVQQPAVTVRDTDNNVIPESEYKVTYVTDGGKNWKDQGTYTVKVENITGGNYEINTATEDFVISTSAQAPLEIVNKPGLVYYGDTFTLSATGGSSSEQVRWSSSDTTIADIDANGSVTIKGVGQATIKATKAGGTNYEATEATYPLNALAKPITAIVTADDKVYDGNTRATIHVTWGQGALVGTDTINTTPISGTFADAKVGTNKTVTITGTPVSDATSQKYDITIPSTATASITKAVADAPSVAAVENLVYDGTAKTLVSGGDTNTLYSTTENGVYSTTPPQGTNAGSYTVWYKAKGDDNHTESVPQGIEVKISPKTLTVDAADVELTGDGLQKDENGYYYQYDGADKTPAVIIKDGSLPIPSSEYAVSYSRNRDAGTATVTVTDNQGGNYNVSVTGTVQFTIKASAAELTGSPQDRKLTYTGNPQELVTVGTATGGHIEYKLSTDTTYSTDIPEGTNAGEYTVDYKVVGENGYTDGPTGSVSVTIQPKTVASPKITVTGAYTYTGSAIEPTGAAVTVEDSVTTLTGTTTTTIPASEYTLTYRDNVNAGTATVIVNDNSGGNYAVSGSATFEIGKANIDITSATAPTGKTDLHYTGEFQELLATAGTATGGTLVYSLTENGAYSAAIPTAKAVGEYEIWYKVQGDGNHNDSAAAKLAGKVKIETYTVADPLIQVTPESVTYNGRKQEPTVTVKVDGLTIDGSEYTVTYVDTANSNNSDLIQPGTYTVTVTGKGTNYSFSKTAEFTILPADQTPLTITGIRERVCYGDAFPLGTNGGIDGGTVTWAVDNASAATIDPDTGRLEITGVGDVTVRATSSKTGYADKTATWPFHADKKAITAIVTAADRAYTGGTEAELTVAWKPGDVLTGDSIDTATTPLTGAFTDPNVGTDKTVRITGTLTDAKYDITVPATTTASITKADIAADKVTAPTPVGNLKYTGQPLALVAAGSAGDGTVTYGAMEYSTDGTNYSAALPTGTDAKTYDVWYRVKGDSNHNDTTPVKMGGQATIGPQDVDDPFIEFTPNEVSYNGQVQKPTVTVKDANSRVIPDSEYAIDYGTSDWKSVSTDAVKHTVKITDANTTGGNYAITTKTAEFTILPAGQDPLSIVNQPGTVRYGTDFTLSVTGGSGAGTVSWSSSAPAVAQIDQNGLVKVQKAGGPVTITATRTVEGHATATATWSFSAEKKPVTAIVTAEDKPYDGGASAALVIDWNPGDVLSADVTALSNALHLALTGTFNSASAGENKTVTITDNGSLPDGGGKYEISYNRTTRASITPAAASVTAPTPLNPEYSGSPQNLVSAGSATNGTITYSLDGIVYGPNLPQGKNAGSYTVWYKVTGDENYKDVAPAVVPATISAREVTSPTIELSPPTFEYDGTAKKPDVTVKDGSTVIPASEYTARYSDNISVGTATVTITDNDGGNYTVSGSTTFTITAAAVSLTNPPEPRDLTYTGRAQSLVTPGSALNGKVLYYSEDDGTYGTAIPRGIDAGDYEVWYKVVDANGSDAIGPVLVEVTIAPKPVTPTVLLNGQYSYSAPFTGGAITPTVTVKAGSQELTLGADYTISYSKNTNVGTAEIIVESTGDCNYEFFKIATFEITKAKAEFSSQPAALQNLSYNGTAQPLVSAGTGKNSGIVVYSLDNVTYTTAIPTAINRGSYTVYAKVQGGSNYENSDVVTIPVTIGVNTLNETDLTVILPAPSFPYTGSEIRPTVTVLGRDGNVIDSSEYTVTYRNNMAAGTAKIEIKSKTNSNYSFTAETQFQITDASQTPLTITGKPEGTVCYGDSFSLSVTGGSGAVKWESSDTDVATIDPDSGAVSIKKAGGVTITATKGGSTVDWTFYAYPKPVTATVYATDKAYDGTNTATLTVTISSGLVPGDSIPTNTANGVKAEGQFTDESVGTNKMVLITGLTVPAAVSEKYDINYNTTTTASITPKPASVTAGSVTGKTGLTYNAAPQELVNITGVTVEGSGLMYSTNGQDYGYTIPTGTDAGTYPVWYKVAGSGNYKDSEPVSLGTVTISANQDTPKVQCRPATLPYNGTAQTPDVEVRDNSGNPLPESEYTVELPANAVSVGKYAVTVTDSRPGAGNYEFSSVTVPDAFEIVRASENHLTIDTAGVPTTVTYGEQIRLKATGYSGDGAIHWDVTGDAGTAAITSASGDYCIVTVTGTGSFTVEAYQAATTNYGQSNTDSVPFMAQPKVVTPQVTVAEKYYDKNTTARLTATVRSSDLVNSTDEVILAVQGVFASPDAGTGKRVDLISHTVGGRDAAKYTVNWPDSVTTGTINRATAEIAGVPGAATGLEANGTPQPLLTSAGTTKDGIGTVEYRLDQESVYSTTIPTGTAAGTYRVWYQVADSENYYGVAPAYVDVVITAPSNNAIYSAPASPPPAQNGTATTVVSAEEGSALVREAVDNQSESVVIQSNAASGAAGAAVSIPVETVSKIRSETNAALTVSTPIADVTIPNGGLDTLSGETGTEGSQTGTVNVAVTRQESGAVALTLVGADGKAVSEVPGGVTLAVPVEKATPGTVAMLVGEDGSRQVIQKSVTKDGTVSVPLDGSATVELVDNSKSFADVSSENWASDAVAFASARELFVGTGGDSFEPETEMSRSMLAEVLYRLEGSPTVQDADKLSGVSSDAWYADSAAWAVAKGITTTGADGGFQPDDAVTREQFALMLWNYSHAGQVSSDAQEALRWAAETGILIGRSEEQVQLDPEDKVTRAEAAQMVKNFLEKI